jgi:hypothetical protein
LSSSGQWFALIAVSGIQKKTKMAQMTVKIPYDMKIASQDFKGELDGMNKRPNANRPFRCSTAAYLIS